MAMKAKTAVKKTDKTNKAKTQITKTANVDGAALKKAIDDRENNGKPAEQAKPLEVHKFFVGVVYGAKWGINKETGKTTRIVEEARVWSDHDLANEPEEISKAMNQAREGLCKKGYFLWDEEARDEALAAIEAELDQLRHDIDYRHACPRCVCTKLTEFVDAMKAIREFDDYKWEVLCDVKGDWPVLPDHFTEEFTIENGYARRINPIPKETHIQQVKSIDEIPSSAREILTKAITTCFPADKADIILKKLGVPAPTSKALPPPVKGLPPAKK